MTYIMETLMHKNKYNSIFPGLKKPQIYYLYCHKKISELLVIDFLDIIWKKNLENLSNNMHWQIAP